VLRRNVHRLALIGGASALAVVALALTVSPSPAANTTPVRMEVASPLAQGSAQAAAPSSKPELDGFVRASGRIGSNLTEALTKAGVPERIGREYVGVLRRAIRLEDGLSVEDKFDLVYEPGASGRLVYVGLDRVARADVELLKWTDGKEVVWINGDGVGGEQSQGMRMPVNGRVTSGFGSRFHPILGYVRMHAGLDLAASYGSPIKAAADGRVVSSGWSGGYGNLVKIAHAGGIQTMYGHMSRIVARAGSMVHQGEVIGYVGSTGLSTGPHLHYEVLKNGRPVDPRSVKLAAAPAQLQGEKLHQFQGALRSLMVLPASRT
jgi:murein DD-endopeptidase MepM/ murein hydrolase activator NlpD